MFCLIASGLVLEQSSNLCCQFKIWKLNEGDLGRRRILMDLNESRISIRNGVDFLRALCLGEPTFINNAVEVSGK